MPYQRISASVSRPELLLTSLEQDVIVAVVTKFAADLVLFRLSHPGRGEAAALEEVATNAALMLNEKRSPTLIESFAVEAIIESVSTGSTDEFFEAVSASGQIALSPSRLKQAVQLIHGKLTGGGFAAAA